MSGRASQFVVFSLDDQQYGLPIQSVKEILRMMAITRIPELPPSLLGVVNLRGQIVPILDIRKKFSMDPRPPDDNSRVLILENPAFAFGFLADRVIDVLQLVVEEAASAGKGPTPSRAVTGVAEGQEGLIVLVDPVRTFVKKEIDAIRALGAPRNASA